ncbi:MAG: LysM peptidoglycan-binding domain-containing protein [Gemmatimonadota bacterium]
MAAIVAAGDSIRRADPDSAADAAILEQLATAHPEPQDSGIEDGAADAVPGGANGVATPEVTYDIDVSTYGSHARVQYYLDFFQGPARERFAIWLQRMPRFEPMIRAKLRENGVPEDMVYLALIESGYSNSAVSRARATGMWQFMKGTGKLYGLRIDSWIDERRDPIRATDAAARHLADLRDRFGSMYLAAAAYNAGAGKVGRGLRRIGDDDEEDDNPDATFFRLYDTRFLRRETKDYVPKLIAAALIAKQPEKYGFQKTVGVEPMSYDSIFVADATGLDVLARLADTSVATLRELNPQFIRLVTPPHQSSVVRLPAGSGEMVTSRYAALEPRERVSFVDHTVGRGQTLASIARLYHVSTRLITDANPGVRVTRLRSGTHLMIPTSFVPTVAEPVAAPVTRSSRAGAAGTTTIRYRVRSGESLSSIAGKYATSVDRLRSLNAIGRSEVLRAGQVIRVPAPTAPAPERSTITPAAGKGHLVRRGETLSGIATKYGVTLSALRAANGLTVSSVLKAGERLIIPE